MREIGSQPPEIIAEMSPPAGNNSRKALNLRGTMWIRESQIVYVGKARQTQSVCTPLAVFNLLSHLDDLPVETFCVICLNNKNAVLTWQEVSRGTVNESLVHPREIFRIAILHGATSIILVHNHPSGVLDPSREDIATTKRLIEAGKILAIVVLDHIIIGGGSFVSLKSMGYVD